MVRFTPLKLLAVVSLAGMSYAVWFWNDQRVSRLARAGACRANLNLIDGYIAFWERGHGALDARSGPLDIVFRADGRIASSSGAPESLRPGFEAVARVARDTLAFRCPDEPSSEANHYRWMMAAEPLPELGGGLRGAVCLAHGARRPPGERAAWHALVKGRNP